MPGLRFARSTSTGWKWFSGPAGGEPAVDTATPPVSAARTRVGGIGEVVEDGASGFLVPPDDPAALAAALAPLLSDPALRARCGARARQRFEAGFTENAMFDKTIAVYREACGE